MRAPSGAPAAFGIKVLCAPVSLAWPRHVNSPPRPPPPCALEPGARAALPRACALSACISRRRASISASRGGGAGGQAAAARGGTILGGAAVPTAAIARVVEEATLQRRTVLSSEPDASVSPSGEKATLYTLSVWPLSVAWELA